jgi:phosphoethanolamine N-methyltransferase
MADHDQEYDDALVALLEAVWGEGFLSPGGPEEVALIVRGLDLRGARVLDIGCGTGGAAIALAERHGAGEVVGVDVVPALVDKAGRRAHARDLADRVQFRTVEPGPLPFAEKEFDVVFSKDSLLHIPDKLAISHEALRVLRPGGVFAASDWMRSDAPISAQLQYYIDVENLGFGLGSAEDYRAALEGAGFSDVELTDRNAWYRGIAHAEHAALDGPLFAEIAARVGEDFARHEVEVWRALTVVLDSGELRPTHLRARRPEEDA